MKKLYISLLCLAGISGQIYTAGDVNKEKVDSNTTKTTSAQPQPSSSQASTSSSTSTSTATAKPTPAAKKQRYRLDAITDKNSSSVNTLQQRALLSEQILLLQQSNKFAQLLDQQSQYNDHNAAHLLERAAKVKKYKKELKLSKWDYIPTVDDVVGGVWQITAGGASQAVSTVLVTVPAHSKYTRWLVKTPYDIEHEKINLELAGLSKTDTIAKTALTNSQLYAQNLDNEIKGIQKQTFIDKSRSDALEIAFTALTTYTKLHKDYKKTKNDLKDRKEKLKNQTQRTNAEQLELDDIDPQMQQYDNKIKRLEKMISEKQDVVERQMEKDLSESKREYIPTNQPQPQHPFLDSK